MTDFVLVYVTVGSRQEAERLAKALVEERLAACVNRVSGVRSTYVWKGKVETDEEELLIIKTRCARFEQLEKRVRELHSYDVPEVIAVPLVEGSAAYLQWMAEALP